MSTGGTAKFPTIPAGLAGSAPSTAPKFALAHHRNVVGANGVAAAFNAGATKAQVAETVRTWP